MQTATAEIWAEDFGLPLLVLTARTADGKYRNPDLLQEIRHQGGGYSCTQFKKTCIVLPIRQDALPLVSALAGKWLNSCAGGFDAPTLRDANEYSSDLSALGLTCETCYTGFSEGIYPFDTSAAALRKLTDFELPEDLDDLLVFEPEHSRMFGIIGRWQAYILGENCD